MTGVGQGDSWPKSSPWDGACSQKFPGARLSSAASPDEFQGFSEDDYVKIVWTLRADPVGTAESIFRTETRVRTTDPVARAKFRRYWSFLSPGIILIRWISLGPLKAEAERRARAEGWSTHTEAI